MPNNLIKKQWAKEVAKHLVGKQIRSVRYMTNQEVKDASWYHAAIVIELDDKTLLYPMADDEGNDAGALGTNNNELQVIPVI